MQVSAPELRIISDDLWERAQARFIQRRRKFATGRPDIESLYLLSGFATCGACGGGLAVHSRPHGRQRRHFYACTNHWKRGDRACANNLVAPLQPLEEEVLGKLEADICHPDAIEEAIRVALAEFAPVRNDEQRAALVAELATVQQECGRLTEAIARGGPLDTLVTSLADREARREALERELRLRSGATPTVDLAAIEARLRAKLAEWRRLLRTNVADGREVLRLLLVGKLWFTPIREERRRGYAFEGTIALDRVLSGVVELPAVGTSPTGFEPVFWP